MTGTVILVHRYTRADLRAEPGTLFVFGDNLVRHGYGGQAKEARGEPNAVGIPTKRNPSSHPSAFFDDGDYDRALIPINEAFARLESHLMTGGNVVLPADGVGTGLAKLAEKAPRINEMIQSRWARLVQMGSGE